MGFPKGPMLRVTVRKELITKAVTADSTKCWIAEAIREAAPYAQNVAVDLATTRFSNLEKGLRYVYLTPYTAQTALIEFDEGTPPAPFAFTLRNAHVTRAGTSERVKATQSKRRAKAKAKAVPKSNLKTAILVRTHSHAAGNLPRRVGGRRPPQLKMRRMFGIRAFRGASRKRIEADAAAEQRAETPRN